MLLGTLSKAEVENDDCLLSSARLLAASYNAIDTQFRVPYFDLQG